MISPASRMLFIVVICFIVEISTSLQIGSFFRPFKLPKLVFQKTQYISTRCQQTIMFNSNGDNSVSNGGKDVVDETTEKYGLEAGLYKAVTEPESSKVKASDLLKKYGIAYLATSITLAIISFSICYVLVANGVDVASLLKKVGLEATTTTANAGTLGIAYAIHKAASPIRFPPTVALTPVVAGWLGKKEEQPK